MNEHLLETALGRHSDVFSRLGDREPSSFIEAEAVIENIRAEKGYLDEETLRDLHRISEQSRNKVLHLVRLKRETEAAYTTRFDLPIFFNDTH